MYKKKSVWPDIDEKVCVSVELEKSLEWELKNLKIWINEKIWEEALCSLSNMKMIIHQLREEQLEKFANLMKVQINNDDDLCCDRIDKLL